MSSTRLQITFTQTAYDTLKEVSEKEGRVMADVVRNAVEEYLTARGYEIDTSIQRGGVRPKKDNE